MVCNSLPADRIMIIRQFLQWAPTATASQRAEAAGALARAYLYAQLSQSEREEADLALTGLLDDPSPLVRRALAESFASAADAPHHIVLGLADDQSDISAIVLQRSPILSDADLIDCAAIGDAIAQSAIALRPCLSAAVAAAIAEVGAREALISLAINPGAEVPAFSMERMVQRFGSDGEVRQALLSRPNLPVSLRADLVAATADLLRAFVTERDWMSSERATRVTREACEQAHIIIAATNRHDEDGASRLIAHLCASGQLTAGLLLRGLLSGNTSLLEAALAQLADVPLPRAKGIVRDWRNAGFAALYRRAGLPDALLPAFRAAIDAHHAIDLAHETGAALSRQRIERVLTACSAANNGELDRLLAVLRRFDSEAAREEARQFSAALPQQNTSPALATAEAPRAIRPMPEEPPLLLVDCDAVDADPRAGKKHRRLEPPMITIDLAAIEAELAAA